MVIEIGVVEVPDGADMVTAASVGIGSMAVEFIRTHPEVLKEFHAWLDGKYPDAGTSAEALSAGRLAKVDEALTLLAARTGGFDVMPGGEARVSAANGSNGSNGHRERA